MVLGIIPRDNKVSTLS